MPEFTTIEHWCELGTLNVVCFITISLSLLEMHCAVPFILYNVKHRMRRFSIKGNSCGQQHLRHRRFMNHALYGLAIVIPHKFVSPD